MNRTPPRVLAIALALGAAALVAGCPSSPKESCISPSVRCGDRCVAAATDPSNCGACGNVCAAGSVCCNARCVDVHADDPADCGACGRACAGPGVAPADATCAAGDCQCHAPARDCRATGASPPCVDVQTDAANCGACGHACANRSTCAGGACACGSAAYPDDCGPTLDPVCVNSASDPMNCGGCGRTCTGSTPSCQGGLCCPAGQSNCAGSCVDTRTSATSCGACGHACAAGETCCGGACVDTRTSAANCGACGTACGSGRACSAGACVCAGQTPVSCGSTCCAGTACCGTSCQTAHSNGLGGSFYDCNAAYTASTTTLAAASAAAASWSATGTAYAGCEVYCVGRQTGNACAIWCYSPSNSAGKVSRRTGDNNCEAACLGLYGPVSNVTAGTWQ